MSHADTIFAPATGSGRTAIAIIRISGTACASVMKKFIGRILPDREIHYVTLKENDEVIDRAMMVRFAKPKTYTGEDMIELHVHGSPTILSRVSECLLHMGLRLAEAGEFTRRAVQNGKMDLTEAEAIADLVNAETEEQRKQALRQMGGALKKIYDGWKERLNRTQAHLEAAIDFADDDLPPALKEGIECEISHLIKEMKYHLEDGHRGQRLRDGVYAAIIGAPNAGKSSLLNLIAKRDVAIVTSQAGTTRDVLEVPCDLGGYPVTLADTAGLREANDIVEKEGIRRALMRAKDADFRVLVFDATQERLDDKTFEQYQEGDIVVINKCDLAHPSSLPNIGWRGAIPLSTVTEEGFFMLLAALSARAEELAGLNNTQTLTRERHRSAVNETLEALERAMTAPQIDLMAEDIRLASRQLGRITGQTGVEDLLDIIFRDFCLGK